MSLARCFLGMKNERCVGESVLLYCSTAVHEWLPFLCSDRKEEIFYLQTHFFLVDWFYPTNTHFSGILRMVDRSDQINQIRSDHPFFTMSMSRRYAIHFAGQPPAFNLVSLLYDGRGGNKREKFALFALIRIYEVFAFRFGDAIWSKHTMNCTTIIYGGP